MNLAGSIQKIAPKIYSGAIRRFAKWIGVDAFLQRKYGWFQSFATPDRHRIEIEGVSSTFDTSSIGEYRRVTTFLEAEALADLIGELRDDDIFWDVGANTGIYACLAANLLSAGTVVAFEPHPGNIDSLSSNLSINNINNVDIEQCALSNETGEMELAITSSKPGLGLHSLGSGEAERTIPVKTKTGDDIVQSGIQTPTVVKIDVEGGEGQVLDGMKSVLSHPECRLVYCEIHASKSLPNSVYDFGYTPENVKELLRNAGFELEVIDDGGAYMVKGTKAN